METLETSISKFHAQNLFKFISLGHIVVTNIYKSESLIGLLKERAREERALLRNEISLFLTDNDVADGVACSGQPTYEVKIRNLCRIEIHS